MNTQAAFKSYSDKSSARKGAQRAGLGDWALYQQDGKWGFCPGAVQAEEPADAMSEDQAELEITPKRAEPEETTIVVPPESFLAPFVESMRADGELAAAIEAGIEDAEEEETPIAPNNVFGSFAATQLGAQPAADPVRTQAVIRVEKNREERNGVKRPSAGTACANVWDTAFCLSDMSETSGSQHTRIATLSEVVKAAEAAGVNKFTARTQYARWRVYHGLTGRLVQK